MRERGGGGESNMDTYIWGASERVASGRLAALESNMNDDDLWVEIVTV